MYYRIKIILLFISFLTLSVNLFSQSDEEIKANLAREFFYGNQIEKSIDIYEELIDKRFVNEYYNNLLEAYYSNQEYSKAEKLIKKTIKKFPQESTFRADLAYHYLREGDKSKSEKEFQNTIESLSADRLSINSLANYFARKNNNELVVKTFLKGRELLRDNNLYTYELSFYYQRLGLYDELCNDYLNLIESNPMMIHQVKIYLNNLMQQDPESKLLEKLRTPLLKRIQKNSNNPELTHLYFWLLLQEKDYNMAFIQAKSIDKRFENLSGKTVFEFANVAINNNDFKNSSQAFSYIIDKGEDNPYYIPSQIGYLNSLFQALTEKNVYNEKEIIEINSTFETRIGQLGEKANIFEIQYQYAYLLAYYLSSSQKAVDILDDLISSRNISNLQKAEAKLLRADIFLMENDIWEASLTYSQVEKDFKNDVIGSEAKFKNAMLSYYNGDFLWAASQFDMLRSSTSKLIANDAMKYSLLIGDNIDEDSSFSALAYYSKADFYIFQNKTDIALKHLDTLNQNYLYHPIFDEVLYKRAEIAINRNEFSKADSLLNLILLKYPEDLVADDALNLLAELSYERFNDKERAKTYYERIIIDYPSSLYVTNARKRYREL
ncbi:MAG: tetratricopeptide repeat protein, partial [Bacteroidales bacterium]|nr:tetratricopeptide repeat protein [Bacteroidales bacterium]